jgi:hypothetical protein
MRKCGSRKRQPLLWNKNIKEDISMPYIETTQIDVMRGMTRQMKIANQLKVLRERYELGDISKEEYLSLLRDIERTYLW